jgi:hypothetical protein
MAEYRGAMLDGATVKATIARILASGAVQPAQESAKQGLGQLGRRTDSNASPSLAITGAKVRAIPGYQGLASQRDCRQKNRLIFGWEPRGGAFGIRMNVHGSHLDDLKQGLEVFHCLITFFCGQVAVRFGCDIGVGYEGMAAGLQQMEQLAHCSICPGGREKNVGVQKNAHVWALPSTPALFEHSGQLSLSLVELAHPPGRVNFQGQCDSRP